MGQVYLHELNTALNPAKIQMDETVPSTAFDAVDLLHLMQMTFEQHIERVVWMKYLARH